MLRVDRVEIGWFLDFFKLGYTWIYCTFTTLFSLLLFQFKFISKIRMKTRYRDSTRSHKNHIFCCLKPRGFKRSNISKLSSLAVKIGGIFHKDLGDRGKWSSLRKYRFSPDFRQKSWFLTYVNFSLSAKFNRFFIILGGPPWIYQETTVLWRSREKRGFSWISREIVDFIKWGKLGKNHSF